MPEEQGEKKEEGKSQPQEQPEQAQRQSQPQTKSYIDLDVLKDVPVNVTIELGRAKLTFDQILKLQQGSVVELDRYTGSPVDIYANDKLIAKGELIVVDDDFAVRVTEIL